MKKTFDLELQTYYKQARGLLVDSRGQRDKMRQALADDVEALVQSASAPDMDVVHVHFGMPQKLGNAMVAAMDPRELCGCIKRINAWNWFVAVFMIVTVMGVTIKAKALFARHGCAVQKRETAARRLQPIAASSDVTHKTAVPLLAQENRCFIFFIKRHPRLYTGVALRFAARKISKPQKAKNTIVNNTVLQQCKKIRAHRNHPLCCMRFNAEMSTILIIH